MHPVVREIVLAVGPLSPVIIQNLMPASLKFFTLSAISF